MDDPWNWSVDQVVSALCHSQELWIDRPTARRPHPNILEQILRDNGVDGASLLDHVDEKVLKDDFGLAAWNERTSIIHAVNKLQRQSSQYASHRAADRRLEERIKALAREASPALTPLRSTSLQPITPPVEPRHMLDDLPGPLPTSLLSKQEQDVAKEAYLPHIRPGECLIDDGRKKRRKLQHLTRVEPKQIEPNSHNNSDSFLGRKKLKLDDLFYDNERLQATTDLDSEPETNDAIFIDASIRPPVGQAAFVKRRMQYFLQSNVQQLDASRTVRQPYPDRLFKGHTKHLTLFTHAPGIVLADKKDASFSRSTPAENDGAANGDESWNFMAEWSKSRDDDEVLPIYGESDSDNDADSSLIREMEADKANDVIAAEKRQSLTSKEVGEIVNDSLRDFAQRWKEQKLPRRRHKALSVWKKARGRNRAGVIQACKSTLDQYLCRLEKLKQGILDETWTSAKSVKNQSGSMEVTIEGIQDCEWKLSLWGGPRPPHVSSKLPQKPARTRMPEDDESGEVLSSDSDLEVGDVLGDFVDIDGEFDTLPSQVNSSFNDGSNVEASSTYKVDSDPENLALDHETPTPVGYSRETSKDSVLGSSDEPHISSESREIIDLTVLENTTSDSMGRGGEADYGPHPEEATSQQIMNWSWQVLLDRSDRKRIIMKILEEIEPDARRGIDDMLINLEADKVHSDMEKAMKSILVGKDTILAEFSAVKTNNLFLLARLFICWYKAMNSFMAGRISKEILKKAMEMKDFPSFHHFISSLIETANSSDEEESLGPEADHVSQSQTTPRKRRKNKVIKDRQAQTKRDLAQERRRAGQERETQLNLAMQSSGLAESSNGILINTTNGSPDESIFLHPHIAERIKPHQIKGVRFMWRELCVPDSDGEQGCLLAHTMGLGKTMQTLSILVTIAEASSSLDERIRRQVPKRLRMSRTLILCPAVLVDNWKDEIGIWVPPNIKNFGRVYSLSAQANRESRFATINTWHTNGGICILSYDLFRQLLTEPKNVQSTQQRKISDEHNTVRRLLLEGPNIVVADEAHKLKNKTTRIAGIAKQFSTKSRIALTGSPLANNLLDYYAMIDWVSPGYLGDEVEFKADYVEPIQAGLYQDSSKADQRKSLKKLKALKTEINPKVDRADVTVMQGDLTKKTEFVIKLPLTDLQRRLYSMFVDMIKRERSSNMSILHWMDLLGCLCNHPSLLSSRLSSRSKSQATPMVEGITPPLEDAPLDPDLTQRLWAAQSRVVTESGVDCLTEVDLSYKVPIIMEIIRESKRMGDQVLLFSHKLPLLDYMEKILSDIPGVRHNRLDGKTKMSGRLDLVKDFNTGSCDVFLMSTKAGGLGLNIASANRVILVDFGFNPTHEEQAVGRAYRIGQKKVVYVYHLVSAGTFEEKLHHLTIFKRQLFQRVVNDKNPNRAANKVNEYLFPPQDVAREDLSGFRGKDIIMDRILESPLGQMICSLQTAETMHAEQKEDLTKEEEDEVLLDIEHQRLRRTDPVAYRMQLASASRAPPLMGMPTPWRAPIASMPGLATAAPVPSGSTLSTANLETKATLGNKSSQASGDTSFLLQAKMNLAKEDTAWLLSPGLVLPSRSMSTAPLGYGVSGYLQKESSNLIAARGSSGRPATYPPAGRMNQNEDADESAFPANARHVNMPQQSTAYDMQPKIHQMRLYQEDEARRQEEAFLLKHRVKQEATTDARLSIERGQAGGAGLAGGSAERAIEIVDDPE